MKEPPDQFNTDSSVVQVIGRTDPEAKVSINDQEITVDPSGRFSQEIKLSDNVNIVTVKAISKSGKVAKVERTVFLR